MRYELDTWKGKVLEIDEQLQMLKDVNRRLKYSIEEIINIVEKIVKDMPTSTIEEITRKLNELEIVLNQISGEFSL